MSNDNKTLADVQPGGRVRLATVPYDRARDLLGDAYNAGTHGIGYSQQTMELHDAIIPAQPSPGGQGDALVEAAMVIANAAHDRALMSDILSGMRAHEAQSLRSAILALDAALAARQPVVVDLPESLHDRVEALREVAARQPVGEPPMEMRICELRHVSLKPNRPYIFTVDANCANCRADAAYAMGQTDTRPAQAVDLGDFKALYRAYVRLLESGRDRILDLGGTCDPVDVMEANGVDLQAARRFIDSQAVGK